MRFIPERRASAITATGGNTQLRPAGAGISPLVNGVCPCSPPNAALRLYADGSRISERSGPGLAFGNMSARTHSGAHGPAPIEAARMRDVLGHFASGIVVITAIGPDGPVGFTCQSFSSLSLDPPLVSFSPSRTSSTWPKIREIGRFCVNMLAVDHEELSAAFARSGTDKYAGVRWSASPSGAPILDGVAAWIDCTVEHEYPGGDHTIVAGRVHDLGADETRSPLLFHRGTYGVNSAVAVR